LSQRGFAFVCCHMVWVPGVLYVHNLIYYLLAQSHDQKYFYSNLPFCWCLFLCLTFPFYNDHQSLFGVSRCENP